MRSTATLFAMLLFLDACGAGGSPRERMGASDDYLGGGAVVIESVDLAEVGGNEDCRNNFASDDVAGFVQKWFDVLARLQRSVDANPVRQLVSNPDTGGFAERREALDCGARILAPFAHSSDRRIAELARATSALLVDAMDAERRMSEVFQSAGWDVEAPIEVRARRWSGIRPSARSLSERAAVLTERIVPLLREDGRATYGPGQLRITRAGRDVALRNRGRLTGLTVMVELDVDPGGPLSMTARKVIKWLYHAHGLTFAAVAP
ncbi:MAG: hypothetical protein ABR587_01605 [Candidatus Binatia bacterium]